MNDHATLDPETTRRIERETVAELEKIPGVLAASVWLRDPEHLREAYITGAPGASVSALRHTAADQLRRAGLDFAQDAIHVDLADESAIPLALWRGRILLFDRLDVSRADNHVVCRVHLQRRGFAVAGEAREIDTEVGRARAAARATLHAAEQTTVGVSLGLEGVHVLDFLGRRFLILSIEAAFSRRISRLPGIAAIAHSVEDAACFATLSALERWLTW